MNIKCNKYKKRNKYNKINIRLKWRTKKEKWK